jgi:hypothetical protein
MAKSVSHDQRVVAYPDPNIKRLIEAEAKAEYMSISQVVGKALKTYYNSLSESERQSIIYKSKHSY